MSANVKRLFAEVSVADFLREVFHTKLSYEQIVTLKFKLDPDDPRAFRMGYEHTDDPGLVKVDTGGNNYYCTSVFPERFPARTKEFASDFSVLVLDDPTSKGNAAGVLDKLGQPTYKIQTSSSDQWGYVFDVPPDNYIADKLCAAIRKHDLADKAGNHRARWVRLPAGINTKPSANNFKVRLTEWNPGVYLKVEDACLALGIHCGEDSEKNPSSTSESAFDLAAAIEEVLTAESFHDNLLRLAGHYVATGMKRQQVIINLQELMNAAKGNAAPARWQARFDAIPNAVDSALKKGFGRRAREHQIPVAVGMIPEVVDALEPLLEELREFDMYVYGAGLVEPYLAPRNGRRGPDGKPTTVQVLALARVTMPAFTIVLSRIATYVSKKLKDEKWADVRVEVPDLAARTLYGMPSCWSKVGVIERISETPLLIGSKLIAAPGFHDGVWINAPTLKLPELTKKNAEAALSRIETWLEEFPLDAPNRSVAIALLMVAAMRSSMDLAPGFAISKPEHGSGGSTLTDLASIVHCGRRAPVLSMTQNEEENRKVLESELHSGASFLNLDNLPDGIPFESTLLSQVLTQLSGNVRILGKNQGSPEIPFRRMVLINGNNIAVGRDLGRRILTLRLDPKMDHPEARVFKRSSLLDDAIRERESILIDLFTIAAAYVASGEHAKVNPLVGYDEFRERIAAALVWLGKSDVITAISIQATPDETATTLGDLLPLWKRLKGNTDGLTVSKAFMTAGELGEDDCKEFQRLIAQATKVKFFNGRYELDATQFGYWLRRVRDRVIDGHRFEHAAESHKTVRWRVVCIESPCPRCSPRKGGHGGHGSTVEIPKRVTPPYRNSKTSGRTMPPMPPGRSKSKAASAKARGPKV